MRLSKGWGAVCVIMLLLLLDQVLKIWIKTHLQLHESIEITPWFYLYFTENPGMAFGIEVIGKLFLSIVLPQPCKAEVLSNGDYPCHGFAVRPVTCRSGEDVHKAVMQNILRILNVPQNGKRIAVYRRFSRVIESFQRFRAACCNSGKVKFHKLRFIVGKCLFRINCT